MVTNQGGQRVIKLNVPEQSWEEKLAEFESKQQRDRKAANKKHQQASRERKKTKLTQLREAAADERLTNLTEFAQDLTLESYLKELANNGVLEELGQAHSQFTDLTDLQIQFIADFVDVNIPEMFAICARGGSKTMLAAIGAIYLMLKYPKFQVKCFAGSLEQLDKLTAYTKTIINCFSSFLESEPTKKEVKLLNGSVFKRFVSTQTGSRGDRADLIIFDESVLITKDVFDSAPGQLSASVFALFRALTTPLTDSKDEGRSKQRCDDPNTKVWNWTWQDCPWTNVEHIKREQRRLSHSAFNAEYMGIWGAEVGAVYDAQEIDIATISRSELPSLDGRFNVRVGVDFGITDHESYAVKGFLSEGYDKEGAPSHILYIYDSQKWTRDDRQHVGKMMTELVAFSLNVQLLVVEDETFQLYINDELERQMKTLNKELRRSKFKGRKENMTQALKARLNHYRIRICADQHDLLRALKFASYDKRGKIKKVKGDDSHDALLHLVYSYEEEEEHVEMFEPLWSW